MAKFILSAFADEASGMVDDQIDALKRNGMSMIEPRNVDNVNISDLTDEQVEQFKSKLAANGISISSLGSPIGKIKVTDDFEPHFEKFKRTVEIARKLNTDKIRMFSFYVDNDDYEGARDEVIRRLKIMCDYAKSHGVKCCHENEKGIYGDTEERVIDLLDNVPGLCSVFDPANFIQCGVVPAKAINNLAQRTEYIHIKDAIMSDGSVVPAGNGDGDIATVLSKFADRDGDVILTIEPHLFIFDGLKNLQDEELTHKFVFEDSNKAFDAAVSALKTILTDNCYDFR